ncbi:hypothetical protein SH449x_002815 [Pirellulaceae bacterium SH449]
MKRVITSVALLTVAMSLGCASLTSNTETKGKKKDKSWFSFSKKEYQVPQSMTVTWAYDVYTIPGKIPTRGFGGRMYFYNEKSQAIPVDGELMVYGFDDTYGDADFRNLSTAAKRFKFTSEQLTNHFDEGQLGASYSVWIPWDAAPGDQKKIMLIPTFVAKDGRIVRGSPATLLLPGRSPDPTETQTTTILQVSGSGTQAATQAVATSQTNPESSHPNITTINVPRRVSSQLAQPVTPELLETFERLQEEHRRELEKRTLEIPANSMSQTTHLSPPPSSLQVPLQVRPMIDPVPSSVNLGLSPYSTSLNPTLSGKSGETQSNSPTLPQPQFHSQPNPHPAPAATFAPPVSYQQLLQQRQ